MDGQAVMIKYRTAVFMGFAVALAVSFLSPEGLVFPFLIFCMGLLIGIFLISLLPEGDSNFLIPLFLSAFLSRIFATLFLYNSVFLYNARGMLGDAWCFSESGNQVLNMWLTGIRDIGIIRENMMKITISGNLGNYDFLNAVVYFFSGKSPISMMFINCLAGSLPIMFIYMITKQVCNVRAARISAILTAFWPSTFMWSIQNLKEPVTIFLIVSLLWAILNLKVRLRFYLVFLIFILSIALKEMRLVSFSVLYLFVIPLSLFLSICKTRRFEFIFSAILVIFIGFLLFEAIEPYIVKYIPHFPASEDIQILKWAHQMRTYRATGRTAFLVDWDLTNPLVLALFVPAALSIAWLAPFPWQLGSASQIMAVPEMLLYYKLIPLMFSGYKFVIKNRVFEGTIMAVYIFIMLFILAFIEGNIGTLFRHRALVLPFMFILIGIGIDRRKVKAQPKVS